MDADEALRRMRMRYPLTDRGRARRQKLADRDSKGKPVCVYCGAEKPLDELIIEHVVPYSAAGPNAADNLVLSCARCDRIKGARTPQEAFGPYSVFIGVVANKPTSARRSVSLSKPSTSSKPLTLSDQQRRERQRLADNPFIGLRFCCTCQRVVDQSSHNRTHLLLQSYNPETDSEKTVL
jgi:5-methylcytosine-specific restriction endonuclease McrA